MADLSQYKKSDLLKRFLALLIDYILASVVAVIPFIGWLIGGAYMLFRDGFDFDFMKHRSFGKQIMKLKVVSLEGENTPIDLKISTQRNWLLALPLVITIIPIAGVILYFPIALVVYLVEGIKVVNDASGRRYGDEFAKTIVIEE